MARSRSPIDRVVGAIVPKAVGAVDPDDLVQRVDFDRLLERLDVDAVVQRVDVDALVQRVDLDALLDRVDIDALVRRVDLHALLQRVDVDALIARVDLDALLVNVDVSALARRAGIDRIVAETTTGLAARTLNLARRQVVAVDGLLLGLVDRLLGREPVSPESRGPRAAGPLGRILAFIVDSAVVSTLFTAGVGLGSYLFELFTGRDIEVVDSGGPAWAGAFLAWWFAYLWLGVAATGRTVGKVLVGLRVTATDGSVPGARRGAVRAAAFPFSFVLGLGFVPAIVGRDRRALHDHVAGTAEVVDWADTA